MAHKNVENESSDESVREPEEKISPTSTDQIGSEEFYQGEKVIEDITLPGEKKKIKTESVKKEEIYKDKTEKQAAFIASLGRKRETAEKSGSKEPEHVEENKSGGKKMIYSVLVIILLGAISGGGYWFWSGKKKNMNPPEEINRIVIPISQEPSQDISAPEQPVLENNKIEEIKLSEIAVRVLNVGAPSGSAGRVKDFLVKQGYLKAEAGNGQGTDVAKSYIFYKEEKFKEKAQAVGDLLLKENKISAEVKPAVSVEEKSADIVLKLGKT